MTKRTELDIEKLVALGCYEEALGVNYDATEATLARAHIRQLHRYSHSERTREALNLARTSLIGESIDRKIQRLIGIDRLETAFDTLATSVGDAPSAYDLYMLGYILYRLKRYVESAQYLERAFDASQSPIHAIWLGCSLERQGNLQGALEKYHWAIENRGNEVEHRLAGNLYFHIGDFKNAMMYLEKAITMGCKDEDVFEKVNIIRQKQKMTKVVMWVKSVFG